MKYRKLRGTEDILLPEVKIWQEIEERSRRLFELFGYQEIRTPIIEPLDLFRRSIGEATDIVEKELFQFQDKSGRRICLRPEATASIARAYVENGLFQKAGLLKLYYIGAMFRAERPQKGRRRQFHQIGVEVIGSLRPEADAEVLYLAGKLLKDFGISDFDIQINTLGCKMDKGRISSYLKDKIKGSLNKLCPDCQRRYERNALRILDCKNEDCKRALREIGLDIQEVICKGCRDHYAELKEILDTLDLNFKEDNYLVRGLDYYTRTVFEITSPRLGAQNAVAAGGRYDSLIEEVGGPPTGAVGFALGIERLILLLADRIEVKGSHVDVFLVLQDRSLIKEAMRELMSLRENGIHAEMDYQARSLKSQMRLANALSARYVLIFGADEWERGMVSIKDMRDGRQWEVELGDALKIIKGG